MTPAVNNGIKHLVDYVRQPDDKSLGMDHHIIPNKFCILEDTDYTSEASFDKDY